MLQRKISFLMAAHNEGKIISKSLNSLLNLPYKNYEVIVGLDGCTDNTLDIVKSYARKSNKFKYKELNLRRGKPAVIDEIIKLVTGDIIIIQDADWMFKSFSEKKLKESLSVFDDEKVGGIAESFPVEWSIKNLNNSDYVYRMVAYSTFLWMKFQKEKLTKNNRNFLLVKNPTMFMTNIFRKKLYKKNFSLGDDFERTQYIFNKGYKIVVFPNEDAPRMIATYDRIKFSDFFRQKIRTAIARRQLNEKGAMPTGVKDYYLPAVWFIFLNSWRISFYVGTLMTFWILITSLATFISVFKKSDTKEGWELRAKR